MSAIVAKYFKELSDSQLNQFEQLESLYKDWNSKINVISRKDFSSFYIEHVLHSLGIAKVCSFKKETEILDIGTGGGFPGIPLAILFPQTEFQLIDSIGKKIKVVQAIANALELKNIKAKQERAENINKKYDFVISRAVTQMPKFMEWVDGKIKFNSINQIENGILYLKGGDLREEMRSIKNPYVEYSLNDYFEEEFFLTKKVVHVKY